jgi:hypothetical protein
MPVMVKNSTSIKPVSNKHLAFYFIIMFDHTISAKQIDFIKIIRLRISANPNDGIFFSLEVKCIREQGTKTTSSGSFSRH